MKIAYNFVSLVALGNFNPAIVTPDFLNKDCELNLGEPTDQTPPLIPVHRGFQFQNLRFTVDMERLEMLEIGINNISNAKILGIFYAYYKKLPYTPLSAVGVNINCDLPKTDILLEKISNPRTYLDFLDVKEIDVTERSLQTKSDKTWLNSNYRIENLGGLTRIVSSSIKKNFLILNYNYEAGNLGQNESRLDLLLDGYEQFCREFLNFVKFLEA
jgi:hypothetical protein